MGFDLGGMIFGSDQKTRQASLLSKDQQKLLKDLSTTIREGLGTGATPSAYAPYATSDMYSQAMSGAGSLVGQGTGTIMQALQRQASGTPKYTFDAGAISKEWKETYATPLMATWRDEIAPMVKESYNVPGMFSSSLTGRGMSDAANSFYSESVAPSLFTALQTGRQQAFQSGEAAASRQLAGAQALGQAPTMAYSGALGLGQMELAENSRMLAALRGEEQRMMSEYNPWLQSAMQTSMTGTMENIVTPGQQGILPQAVGAGLGAYFGSFGGGATSGATAGGTAYNPSMGPMSMMG